MQLEVGNILEGKVTGITKFGAFVQLSGGRTGMVHISEVSNAYVKEISDHLSENDAVKVKVLSISEDGKISLSIKRCLENAEAQPQERPVAERPARKFTPRENRGWQPKRQPSTDGMSFEDMMARFKQTSNDRMSDLKRGNEPKRTRRSGPK